MSNCMCTGNTEIQKPIFILNPPSPDKRHMFWYEQSVMLLHNSEPKTGIKAYKLSKLHLTRLEDCKI